MRMDQRSTELLTEAEAAEMLRSSVPTLRRWRRLGTGPASIKSGRKVLYRREALDRWLAERETRDGEG
jgi:excisionase family DNA binding protein